MTLELDLDWMGKESSCRCTHHGVVKAIQLDEGVDSGGVELPWADADAEVVDGEVFRRLPGKCVVDFNAYDVDDVAEGAVGVKQVGLVCRGLRVETVNPLLSESSETDAQRSATDHHPSAVSDLNKCGSWKVGEGIEGVLLVAQTSLVTEQASRECSDEKVLSSVTTAYTAV